MINYRLMEHITEETICVDSDIYSLEYCSKEDYENKLFLGIPLLVFDGRKYYPVFGKRYIDNYIKIQHYLPYSFIVEKTETPYEVLINLIHLKEEMKGYNVIEKALALKKLHDVEEKFDSDLLKMLKIPNNERYIRGNLTLATASENIKELVLTERINVLTVFEIFQFDKQDWEIMAGFIAEVKLGTKKRNKIVNMIYDVAKRDKRKVKEIVESDEIREILALKMDQPHIGQKLYSYLEDLCYPYISQYKKRFHKKLKDVGIERYFRLKIPPNFENWAFDLTFSFSSAEDFKSKVELLENIGSKQSFQELMNLR